MSDYNLYIDTPENLTLEAEVAGFGSRCVAAMIDYLLLSVVILIFTAFFGGLTRDASSSDSILLAIYIFLIFALFTFYHLTFELLMKGQTPGKKLFGMRVVQQNGLPATTAALVIRNFVRMFDFLPLFYGVGLGVMFFTQHSQRLGDMAARTIVIRERPQITLSNLQEKIQVDYVLHNASIPLPEYVDVRRLSSADRLRIQAYFQRRWDFIRREEIVVPFARQIAQHMEIQVPVNLANPVEAERFLEQIARAIQEESITP